MNFEEIPFLKKGSCIGITAPSFGCTTEPYSTRIKNAVRKLEQRGYRVKIGKTVYMSDGIGISTDPETAAHELEEFYLDPHIDAVISAGGGELMCTTMSFLNFEKLSSVKPKLFMGYSDNTNFIYPMSCLGIPGIYGPCISGLGKTWEQSEIDAVELLEGTKRCFEGYSMFQLDENHGKEDETGLYCLTEKKILVKYNWPEEYQAEGIILGGCLDILALQAGTRLDFTNAIPENKKVIWAFESCEANPMEFRRQLWHLDECGWFKNVSAFLIGRPLMGWKQEMMGADMYNGAVSILGKYNVPICMDCDIGHLSPMMPLLMGVNSKVKIKGNDLKICY